MGREALLGMCCLYQKKPNSWAKGKREGKWCALLHAGWAVLLRRFGLGDGEGRGMLGVEEWWKRTGAWSRGLGGIWVAEGLGGKGVKRQRVRGYEVGG